jgi:hypothetical protein
VVRTWGVQHAGRVAAVHVESERGRSGDVRGCVLVARKDKAPRAHAATIRDGPKRPKVGFEVGQRDTGFQRIEVRERVRAQLLTVRVDDLLHKGWREPDRAFPLAALE